jgi:hypothetical protein
LYPAQGANSVRPHAPQTICGSLVAYDANGNTISYDVEGTAGPKSARSFTYDLENRPLSITRDGTVTVMAYGADGERVSKTYGGNSTYYLGNEAEVLFNSAYTSGQLSSYLHPDVKREGVMTDFMVKDHLASNRVMTRMGVTRSTRSDYGPYGQPLSSNGATTPNASLPQTKGYINERVACPREGGGPRNRPAISPREILRPRPRPLPHPRLVGPLATRGRCQQVRLCWE